MSNRYVRILVAGGAAVLVAALGVPAALAAATAKTWTVPGQPNRPTCAATHCWKVPAGRPVTSATVGTTVVSSRVPSGPAAHRTALRRQKSCG